MQFILNKIRITLDDALASHRLLWILRDQLNILGPKYGCGIGVCGACTVHLDGEAVRACSLTGRDVENRNIVTLEGLAESAERLHPVQKSWIETRVPQCGYCQNGQIMTAAALLDQDPHVSDADISDVMDQVRCRCGSQGRIRAAIRQARDKMQGA